MFIKLYADLKLSFFKEFFKPDKSKKMIHLFKVRKGYAGEYVGLGVSSDLTNQYLKELGFNSESFGVVDDNKIDKILHDERPDFLIIKAFWVRKDKIELLAKKYTKTKFIIVSHSKPTFLATENKGFERLFEVLELANRLDNVFLGLNNLDFFNNFEYLSRNVVYVPNIILPENWANYKPKDDVIKVGLFCAIRPMKNILNSAVAAISAADMLGKKLELYVITDRVEMGGDVTLKNLRELFVNLNPELFELIELGWMTHEQFNEQIRHMDIGLQVSFTETLNIVAIDFLNNNVPVITAPSINWSAKLAQANPDDIEDIKGKIILHYNNDLVSKLTQEVSYLNLINYNIEGAKQYRDILTKL
jgi:hypothetical protein